jgi:hypothetical protein
VPRRSQGPGPLRLGPAEGPEFIIGATDDGVDHTLPPIVTELGVASPALNVKFRFDRTTGTRQTD